MATSTHTLDNLKEIVVIGAGVVGLTTALQIQESGGYHVTIIAETLPSDPKTIRYTSHWAGGHHVSLAREDKRQEAIDRETFKIMWELSAPGGAAEGCFLRLPQTEYYCEPALEPHPLNVMPNFAPVPQDKLVPGAVSGVSFETITIDVPVYLNYLLSRFLSQGGSIVRGALQHISQVIEGGARVFTGVHTAPAVDAVIVCAGIGARTLGGVEDKTVFPIRGQTVLLRAPWVRFGVTLSSENNGLWTYVIPRRSGDVIIGGIRVNDDWYPVPRKATTEAILSRALALCPELAPPSIRAEREPNVDDLRPIIIEEGCGLRPGRTGGIRLEVEWVDTSNGNGKIPIVHNYGHAGSGYQSSWGSASIAYKLLEDALSKKQ